MDFGFTFIILPLPDGGMKPGSPVMRDFTLDLKLCRASLFDVESIEVSELDDELDLESEGWDFPLLLFPLPMCFTLGSGL